LKIGEVIMVADALFKIRVIEKVYIWPLVLISYFLLVNI